MPLVRARRVQLVVKLLLVAAKLAVILLAAEGALQVYTWWTTGGRLMTLNDQMGWRMRANAKQLVRGELGPYIVRTNDRGLRDSNHPYQRVEGLQRIVVIGSSSLLGVGVRMEEICTEVLERRLDQTEVINLGMLGYGPDQAYNYLKTEGLRYRPDRVIQLFDQYDAIEAFFSVHPAAFRTKCHVRILPEAAGIELVPPEFHWWELAAQRSYVAGWLERVLAITGGIVQQALAIAELSELMPPEGERERALRLLLEMTDELCATAGARYTAVYVPGADVEKPNQLRNIINELGRAGDLDTLDVSELLGEANSGKVNEPKPFFDDDHLTPQGHYLVGKALQEFLDAQDE